MTDLHTWVKTLPDIIRSYGLLIMSGIVAISGFSTGGYQYFDKQEVMKKADIELEQSLEQTAAIAEHLGQYAPKPETKVIYKTDCNSCRPYWQKDILNMRDVLEKRYHK